MNRRSFLLQAGALSVGPLLANVAVGAAEPVRTSRAKATQESAPAAVSKKGPVLDALDAFVPDYIKAMNAPGLTLGVVDVAGKGGEACYGYANMEKLLQLTPDLLFQIGSISKSFLAIVLLQLREEGKLDLDQPVLEYMPWLPIETPYGAVTVHHMLTHSSGLPGDAPLFPSNPTDRYRQSWKPGERFHYSNFCFQALGRLAASLEKRPLHECIQQRILDPLGMTATSPVLTEVILPLTTESYTPEMRDRPFGRQCKLTPASKIDSDSGAGAIASTAGDMRKYIRMLLKRGQGEKKRILKEESFALMSHPHVKAEEFGPTASYGYGIAVDTLEGHTILRHTGGMVSFMSAMQLDLDSGVGAFASINAQLGYRPNPVAQFAIQAMRAEAEGNALPAPPTIEDPAVLKDPKEYAGVYHGADGKPCRVNAGATSISLQLDGREVALEGLGGDRFVSALPAYSEFAFVFQREEAKPADAAASAAGMDAPPPRVVIELTHGSRWFSKAPTTAAKALPRRFAAFTGKYINDSPWLGSFHIVERKGQLWVDGELLLIEMGDGLFRAGDEPDSPETVAFFHVVDGRAQMVKSGGTDFWRITTETE
jgi:CubicO group peptidase (beta-lactamase class C family)